MADYPADITATDEWSALAEHYGAIADLHLRTLFADDPGRADALTVSGADLVLDYSKHRITRDTLPLLTALARRAGLPERTEAMFAGVHINTSEDRAVLHTALRAPRELALAVDGQDVPTDVHARAGPHGRVHRRRPVRGVDGPHRRADPRPSSTSASAARTSAPSWPTRR